MTDCEELWTDIFCESTTMASVLLLNWSLWLSKALPSVVHVWIVLLTGEVIFIKRANLARLVSSYFVVSDLVKVWPGGIQHKKRQAPWLSPGECQSRQWFAGRGAGLLWRLHHHVLLKRQNPDLLSWCFEPSQPLGIVSGLTKKELSEKYQMTFKV